MHTCGAAEAAAAGHALRSYEATNPQVGAEPEHWGSQQRGEAGRLRTVAASFHARQAYESPERYPYVPPSGVGLTVSNASARQLGKGLCQPW